MSLLVQLFISISSCHIQNIFALEPNQWHEYPRLGKQYYYYTECVSGQSNMINTCQSLGGDTVASIPSDFVLSWFQNQLILNPNASSCAENIAFGAIENGTDKSNWNWYNGDTWDSNVWGWRGGCGSQGIPRESGVDTDYVLYMSYSNQWFCDASIEDSYSIVCERDSVPTQGPTMTPNIYPSNIPTPSPSTTIPSSDDPTYTSNPTVCPSTNSSVDPSSPQSVIRPSPSPTAMTSPNPPLFNATTTEIRILDAQITAPPVEPTTSKDDTLNYQSTTKTDGIVIIVDARAVIVISVIICIIVAAWKLRKKKKKEQEKTKKASLAQTDPEQTNISLTIDQDTYHRKDPEMDMDHVKQHDGEDLEINVSNAAHEEHEQLKTDNNAIDQNCHRQDPDINTIEEHLKLKIAGDDNTEQTIQVKMKNTEKPIQLKIDRYDAGGAISEYPQRSREISLQLAPLPINLSVNQNGDVNNYMSSPSYAYVWDRSQNSNAASSISEKLVINDDAESISKKAGEVSMTIKSFNIFSEGDENSHSVDMKPGVEQKINKDNDKSGPGLAVTPDQ